MKSLPFGKPILGDAEYNAVREVMDSGILAHGSKIGAFERAFAAYVGADHAVAVASCTAGLHLAYFHLGLGAGDEVLVPAMTHTATAHSVELAGATPIFVDTDPATGNLNLDLIEKLITPRTKAIAVVHYLGLPVDMDRVLAIANKHKLKVIEDCALSIGARYKGVHTGLLGDVGCFSFYPVKHMTTAEGGMVITRHADWAKSITLKRAFGMDRHVGERAVPGIYDMVELGFNYRMNEIEAAIGVEQVKRLDGFLAARKANYEALTAGLQKIDGIELLESTHGDFESSYYCHLVILSPKLSQKRPEIMAAMKQRGVGTSVYYPRPVPLMSYYKNKYGYKDDQFPQASRISDRCIALPVGPHLNTDDMHYIAESLKQSLHAD